MTYQDSSGQEAIREHYSHVFATPPPAGVERELSYDIFSVQLMTPTIAIVDAHYAVVGVGPRPNMPIKGMNTVVLIVKLVSGYALRIVDA